MRQPPALFAIALTGALIGACAPVKGPRMLVQEFPTTSRVACSGLCQDSVTIRYLGVAGFVVRHGSHTLLTGPSFTNPPFHASVFAAFPFTRWMLGTLRPDTTLVDRLLVPDTANIDALLIGHGHYDHALDASRVLARYGAGAMIVGGRTSINMLLGDPAIRATPGHLITIVDTVAASSASAGQWIYSPSGAFRLMAIAADHAPTVKVGPFEWLFANGEVDAPRARLPRTTADWRAGESYSYLIDVLAAGSRDSVALRIYFQDAPNRPPLAVLLMAPATACALWLAVGPLVTSMRSTCAGSSWSSANPGGAGSPLSKISV